MRKYRVYYWAEINDECVDRELEIEARHIVEVVGNFMDKVKLFKRIYKIEEI